MLFYMHEKLAKLMLTNSELANFLQRYPIFLPTRLENKCPLARSTASLIWSIHKYVGHPKDPWYVPKKSKKSQNRPMFGAKNAASSYPGVRAHPRTAGLGAIISTLHGSSVNFWMDIYRDRKNIGMRVFRVWPDRRVAVPLFLSVIYCILSTVHWWIKMNIYSAPTSVRSCFVDV